MSHNQTHRYFITGGAGFIGSHLVNHLLDKTDSRVTVYDNYCNGRDYAYGNRIADKRLNIVRADVRDIGSLRAAMTDHDIVYHLASNADIARSATEPDIDFWNGTYLTHNTLEAMRLTNVKRILFTSGSGVYGEVPPIPIPEKYDSMVPISTYGACKLACESLISAYCHMYDFVGTVVRFANVVGGQQTHGVAYDFIRRLAHDPTQLKIYGNGQQTKPYVHTQDIIAALRMLESAQAENFDVFNVGSEDHVTVTEIADIIVREMNLSNVTYNYTGGARGWKADVPVYQLNSNKIRSMGWQNKLSSREAVEASVRAMIRDVKEGNITAAP